MIEREPLILLQDGKPIERNLNGKRLTLQEVAHEARAQGIGELGEVKWAVLETSAKITFIKA